jgi:hypothetical protein
MLATTLKPKICAMCPREFMPRSSFASCCSQRCAMRKVAADNKAKAAKEKAEFQARKDAIVRLSELEDQCRRIVQKIARIRDRHDGCISCHMGPDYRGMWHGSHFRPAGNNSAVQFHLWNIHKSCAQCNLHKGGNLGAYRPRLVEKIGADRVAWLESQNQAVRYSREYLVRFKKVMGKRLRRIERRAQA